MDTYDLHRERWRWKVPAHFNIAIECAQRWAADAAYAERIAIVVEAADGRAESATYAKLTHTANRLAAVLRARGLAPGDRVAVCMPQRIETAVALLAIFQIGAVAVPLTVLFGPDALEYRLVDAHCACVMCDASSIENVIAVRDRVHSLRHILLCGTSDAGNYPKGIENFHQVVSSAEPDARYENTRADDAALIIYTSGTTGPPKGALIPHRAMFGNMSGFLYSHNLRVDPNKALEDVEPFVFYSPADWAWTGGLWDALLPTLFLGQTIVGYRGRFEPERAFALMEKYQVSATFLFPTALKMMMKAIPNPRDRFDLKLRSIMSAGESVGETVFNWTRDALGVTVNEMFGQTELNYVVGNSAALWPARAGSMGRAYPGHRIAIIGEAGEVLAAGETGDVAVNRFDTHGDFDPVFFLAYLGNDAGTRAKYAGDWCRTGDMARLDADGYLWYEGRSDDVIKSAGYRIGPAEVESCLIQHPAVAMAAVIGKPNAERGAIVKAFIVLAQEHAASVEVEASIAQFVRERLALYEYPKEIEFVTELPMTTTGKIQRKVLRDLEAARVSNGKDQI